MNIASKDNKNKNEDCVSQKKARKQKERRRQRQEIDRKDSDNEKDDTDTIDHPKKKKTKIKDIQLIDTSSRADCSSISWNANDYSYVVDYNDHFETPLQAYQDIVPLLNALKQNEKEQQLDTKLESEHILYDPYYCNGQTKRHLQSLGFDKVYHEKRDFYQDIQQNAIPTDYDTFLTNPPYSDNHKVQCLQFCVQQWQQQQQREKRPCFLLLMPCYVATKQYFKQFIVSTDLVNDMVYVVPNTPYQYQHPEGTGHDTPPFISMWFACVGKDRIEHVKQAMSRNDITTTNSTCTLYTSYQQLVTAGIIVSPDHNRPNPRQRKKKMTMNKKNNSNNSSINNSSINNNSIIPQHQQQRQHQQPQCHSSSTESHPYTSNNNNKVLKLNTNKTTPTKPTTTTPSTATMTMTMHHHQEKHQSTANNSSTTSKYRDAKTGKRIKKRF
jgi:hypothetical protein